MTCPTRFRAAASTNERCSSMRRTGPSCTETMKHTVALLQPGIERGGIAVVGLHDLGAGKRAAPWRDPRTSRRIGSPLAASSCATSPPT